TSNFMIGVTAGAGALVFLARGDVATSIAAPVALGVTAGALGGSRLLPHANVSSLRNVFTVILILIALEMGWRALTRM
ncbi:MAG TPA: TSUP family transporter, partial [Candidatus Binataceae bacterium]|nr:TSUP family transporter [Candidatus Binataceae bacterium]